MYLVFGNFSYQAGGGFSDLIYMSECDNKVLNFLDNELEFDFDSIQVVNGEKDIIIEGGLLEVVEDLKDHHWDSFTDYLSTLAYYNE